MKPIEACIVPGRLTLVPSLVVLTLVAIGSQTTATAQAVEKKNETYSAGQKAAVDPQTRKLRAPTPEESEALDASAKPVVMPTVTPTVLSNGTLKVELPEEYMDASVVQKNPDGTLTMNCVRGMAAADARVQEGSKVKSSAATPAGQTPALPSDKGLKNPAELEKE